MRVISVLQEDPDLAVGVPQEKRRTAARVCGARVLDIPRGIWDGGDSEAEPKSDAGFGLVVLSGILCRRVAQSERYGAELIGPGDLMRPWDLVGDWSTLPTDPRWRVIQPVSAAILDADFTRRAAPFPGIAEALVRRALLRSRYLAILIAIVSQRRIETRLEMLFWHLADRFGHVRSDYVDVSVPLTHSLLGELIGARRQTVTTALSKMQERGAVEKTRGGWRLRASTPPEPLRQRTGFDPGAGTDAASDRRAASPLPG